MNMLRNILDIVVYGFLLYAAGHVLVGSATCVAIRAHVYGCAISTEVW